MQVNRKKALAAFAAYVENYNATDAKVKLKIDHTYRVAALCDRIAKSISLPAADVDTAWLCGLLHDVGRFEQLRRYGTFDDAKSLNHAALSAEVLFDDGEIAHYLDENAADSAELTLLRTAVAEHSSYRLPEGLDERTTLFCNILRDADKVDILRVNVEVPLEEIYNVSTDALRSSPVSPAVVQAFYEHHAVLRALKQYPADNVVGHASLVYELCFTESLRAVAEQGYLWRLMDFTTHNAETAATFAGLSTYMKGWLQQRLDSACVAN